MDPLTVLFVHRVVPVVVIDDADTAPGLAEALLAGGLPVAEVTFRTPAAREAIKRMAAYPEIMVGAGTVRTPEQVDQAIEAGARYIVSPGLSEKVVRHCQERGIPVLPGAVTATEVQAAGELGLDTVKFFPAETSGGAAAIRALTAPFPEMSFVPTGGVNLANLAEYLHIPAVRAVGASGFVPREAIAHRNFATIERLVAETMQLVAEVKEN